MTFESSGYTFLSYWNHVLVGDDRMEQLSFHPLTALPANARLDIARFTATTGIVGASLARLSPASYVPDWIIKNGAITGCLSLLDGQRWIGSNQSAQIFYADTPNAWENFFPLSVRHLANLRQLLLSRWHAPQAENRAPLKLGLRQFNFIFDQKNFPLWQNLHVLEAGAGSEILLRSASGELRLRRCRPDETKPVIWINPHGDIGNRALQYLTAAGIQAHAPEAEIQNIHLEFWGMQKPALRPPEDTLASTGKNVFSIDVAGLGACLRNRQAEAVAIDSYTFHTDHYPAREKCRKLLPHIAVEDALGFGPRELVCNIRGGEVLRGVHPDYFPFPAKYYQLLAEESGLEPVFYGQIEDNPYINHLRTHFPKSRFIPSRGAAADFEVLRRSRNIAVSISTFSWLAAWLSHAERVYIPVGGMFNPIQHPDQLYLAPEEPSFRYVLLPILKAASLYAEPEKFWKIQDDIGNFARFMTAVDVDELLRAVRNRPTKRVMTTGFNAAYYCAQYPDAAADVMSLQISPLGDYLKHGQARESILPFDTEHYANAYPEAVKAVALGRYPSLLRHYLHEGFQKGYTPQPASIPAAAPGH